jgi:hypothetical protein
MTAVIGTSLSKVGKHMDPEIELWKMPSVTNTIVSINAWKIGATPR